MGRAGDLFFPKTPEFGSRLGFGVQRLGGVRLHNFKGVIQFWILFAWFLYYSVLGASIVAHESSSFCIVIYSEMHQSGQWVSEAQYGCRSVFDVLLQWNLNNLLIQKDWLMILFGFWYFGEIYLIRHQRRQMAWHCFCCVFAVKLNVGISQNPSKSRFDPSKYSVFSFRVNPHVYSSRNVQKQVFECVFSIFRLFYFPPSPFICH